MIRTANPYKWTNETVSRILERVEYLGHTVNFKTSKPSFKSKKKVWNNPSEWVIFENTQEAIIEESVFLVVQNIRQARRRPTKMGDMGMFSGLVYCADCGGKMYLCRANHFKPEQEYYICSTYRKDRSLCKTHSIRRVVLEEIVLVYTFIRNHAKPVENTHFLNSHPMRTGTFDKKIAGMKKRRPPGTAFFHAWEGSVHDVRRIGVRLLLRR